MIISKKRIINTNCIKEYKGKKIRLIYLITDENQDSLKNVGFENCEPGEKILPAKTGPVSKVNADGFWTKCKDLPMETVYREICWNRPQWIGGGDYEMVDDCVEVPYKRYPRKFHMPYNIEVYILEKEGKRYVVTDSLEVNEDNDELLKTGINLFLELFHVCYVEEENFNEIELHTKIKRLSYVILPEGEFPFQKRMEQLESVVKPLKKRSRKVIEKHFQQIWKHNPNFMCMGINGFSGYVIFVFTQQGICVFESTNLDNATYVFEGDWEKVSKMTKKEILDESLQKCRIIHRKGTWYNAVDDLF